MRGPSRWNPAKQDRLALPMGRSLGSSATDPPACPETHCSVPTRVPCNLAGWCDRVLNAGRIRSGNGEFHALVCDEDLWGRNDVQVVPIVRSMQVAPVQPTVVLAGALRLNPVMVWSGGLHPEFFASSSLEMFLNLLFGRLQSPARLRFRKALRQ
jgi:hypothetical protein